MDIFLHHLGTRIWRALAQIYFWNWFFWLMKHFKPICNKEKNFFSNFEHYDLTNSKEFESKFWSTCTHTSKVLDPMVTSSKIHQNLKTYTLDWKKSVLRDFCSYEAFRLQGLRGLNSKVVGSKRAYMATFLGILALRQQPLKQNLDGAKCLTKTSVIGPLNFFNEILQ